MPAFRPIQTVKWMWAWDQVGRTASIMTGYLIRDIAPVAAISREPERPRDAQDAINGITDIVNRADLADRAPASSTCKRRAISNLAVAALASLIAVDRRLDGGF